MSERRLVPQVQIIWTQVLGLCQMRGMQQKGTPKGQLSKGDADEKKKKNRLAMVMLKQMATRTSCAELLVSPDIIFTLLSMVQYIDVSP